MIEKIKSYLRIFTSHFSISSNKKALSIVAIAVTAIALPLIVILAQEQQTYRQRASELVSPPTLDPTPTPSNEITVSSILVPPPGSFTPSASGILSLTVKSANVISISGTIKNFSPNRTLTIMLCPVNKATCEYTSSPAIIADSLGSANFNNIETHIPTSSLKLYIDNPLNKAVVVILSNKGGESAGCVDRFSPCLEGSFSIADPSNRVFVTADTYYGGLVGGLSGADAKCQEGANAASLGGVWKAWLSDSVTSVTSRLIHSVNPYKLINGTIIANNWSDLTDGAIQNKINVSQYGATRYISTWTNTLTNGDIRDNVNHCDNWTTIDGFKKLGATGSTQYAGSEWTVGGPVPCNDTRLSLFCFEQVPSTPTTVPSPTPTPTLSPLPISLKTDQVSLQADNFFIKIDDKIFRPGGNFELHSDPGKPTLDTNTLETTWFEDKTEMRLNIYFSIDSNNQWKVTEMRTYDGKIPGNWLYYSGSESGKLGNPFVSDKYSKQSKDGKGYINFGQIKMLPFLNLLVTPTPTPKPSITVISPNGGEKWQIGKTYNVTWNYTGPKDCTVSVFLTNFSNNPASYAGNALPISASLKKYSFKVSPVIPQGENVYKIEVNGGKMCGVSDQSDKYLSVVAAPTPTPIACAVCAADVNGSGTVDQFDLQIVNRCFGKTATVNCANVDVVKDGVININDTTCVSLNYNKKCVK